MSVMERTLTETSLPIYHRSIDWDAPGSGRVCERGGADESAFQNE